MISDRTAAMIRVQRKEVFTLLFMAYCGFAHSPNAPQKIFKYALRNFSN